MKKLFYVLLIVGMVFFWLSQRARLKAYDECYMDHYENWAGSDCELGR
jgi:hypothetical protein